MFVQRVSCLFYVAVYLDGPANLLYVCSLYLTFPFLEKGVGLLFSILKAKDKSILKGFFQIFVFLIDFKSGFEI